MSSLSQVGNVSGPSGVPISSQQSRFGSSFRHGLSLFGVSNEALQRCEDQMKQCQEQAERLKERQNRMVQRCENQATQIIGWVQTKVSQSQEAAQLDLEENFVMLGEQDVPVQSDEDQPVSVEDFVVIERPDPAHDFVDLAEEKS